MEKKVCSKCKEEKEVCEFNLNKSRSNGYRVECRECTKLITKTYKEKNKLKIKESNKKFIENNPDYHNDYRRDKFKNNIQYRLQCYVRARILKYLKSKKILKNNLTFNIVGCTPDELKKHIESQFLENMSWDNHSLYGWHIDHKIPLSSAKTEEEAYQLCHYTNLQPLWAEDNLKKSNKLSRS
jgi:hypothetical protein